MNVEILKQKDTERFASVVLLPPKGESGTLFVFGAEEDGEPVGSLVLFPADKIASVYSVYVKPEHRNKGIGAALVQEAKKLLSPTRFSVLTADFSSDHPDIGYLLESQNFFIHPTAYDYAFSYQNADSLRRQAANVDISNVISVADMTIEQEAEFSEMASDGGFSNFAKQRDAERSLSCGVFEQNALRAIMLCTTEEDGEKKAVRIDYVESKEEGGAAFLKLLRHFLTTLPKLYPEDTEIRFLGLNDRLETLAIEYLGGYLKERATYYQAVGEA